jgi:hypothetical protein
VCIFAPTRGYHSLAPSGLRTVYRTVFWIMKNCCPIVFTWWGCLLWSEVGIRINAPTRGYHSLAVSRFLSASGTVFWIMKNKCPVFGTRWGRQHQCQYKGYRQQQKYAPHAKRYLLLLKGGTRQPRCVEQRYNCLRNMRPCLCASAPRVAIGAAVASIHRIAGKRNSRKLSF